MAFATVEGVFFSVVLRAVLAQEAGPASPSPDELISRDEAPPLRLCVPAHGMLQWWAPLDEATLLALNFAMIGEAVDIERAFVSTALPVGLIGTSIGS